MRKETIAKMKVGHKVQYYFKGSVRPCVVLSTEFVDHTHIRLNVPLLSGGYQEVLVPYHKIFVWKPKDRAEWDAYCAKYQWACGLKAGDVIRYADHIREVVHSVDPTKETPVVLDCPGGIYAPPLNMIQEWTSLDQEREDYRVSQEFEQDLGRLREEDLKLLGLQKQVAETKDRIAKLRTKLQLCPFHGVKCA